MLNENLKECNGIMILDSRGEDTSLYYCSICGLFEEIDNTLINDKDEIRCRYTEADIKEYEDF